MTTDFKQFSLSDFTTVAHQSRRRSDGTPLITINGHQRTYGKDDKVVSGSVSINSAFVQVINADFLRFATQGTTLAVVPVNNDTSNAYRIRNKNHVAAARTLSLNTDLRKVIEAVPGLDLSKFEYRYRFEKVFDGENTFFVTDLLDPYSATSFVREGK